MIPIRLLLALAVFTQVVFRSDRDVVEVSVSVRRGDKPVGGLRPTDFSVLDNGVAQSVEMLDNIQRPVDVTLCIAVDDNHIYQQSAVSSAVERIVRQLQPTDRVRVFLTDAGVRDATGWLAGGASYKLGAFSSGFPGGVADALSLAMAHRPAAGRGHLVIGISHWLDAYGITDSAGLLALTRHTTAVTHIITVNGWRSGPYGSSQMFPRNGIDVDKIKNLTSAAETTGGRFSEAHGQDAVFDAFKSALDDFRQSYVLYFTPKDKATVGWHNLQVTVPGQPRAAIRARSGYFVQ